MIHVEFGEAKNVEEVSALIKKTHGRGPAVHTKSNFERLILILNGQ